MVHAQDGVAVLNVCFEGLLVELEDRKVLPFCVSWGSENSEAGSCGELS